MPFIATIVYKRGALAALATTTILACSGPATQTGARGSDPTTDAGPLGSNPTDGATSSNSVDEGDGGPSNSSSSGSSSSGGVAMSVSSAAYIAQSQGISPASGTSLLQVALTLKNTGTQASLSANYILFSLQTAQLLVLAPNAEQADPSCSPSISIAPQGEYSCTVTFAVPSGQTPSEIRYNDHVGDSASAVLPAIASIAVGDCNMIASWSQSTSAECQECLGSGAIPSYSCDSQIEGYTYECALDGGECTACLNEADSCSCEPQCDSSVCQTLFAAMNACLVSACSSWCS